MAKIMNRSIKKGSEYFKVGAVSVQVEEFSPVDGGVWKCYGTTVPTATLAGFSKGSFFIKTNGSAGSIAYINEGTLASCSFKALDVAGDVVAATSLVDSNAVTALDTGATASAVNNLRVTNSATGNSPSLSAVGTDTNIAALIKGKGTGAVQLGQTNSVGVTLVADQPILDSSANEYIKFSKTASAINEITLTNAGTTGTVDITVTGSDTAVAGLTIKSKAAGAAATAGGAVAISGGLGNTTGAGGAASLNGGVGGNDAVGGDASLIAGAAGGGNRAGGAAAVTAGAGAGTAAGGAITVTSGTSANGTGVSPGASGAINLTVAAPGTATTGTAGGGGGINLTGAAGGASTGASSQAGSGSSIALAAGAGGASSGGSDTAGNGGNIIQTAGAAGAGATNGRDGAIFQRATSGANYFKKVPAPTAKTTNANLTAAEMLTGWITVNQGAGGTSTQTTATGTALASAFPFPLAAGDSFDFHVINISTNAAETAIIAGGTDVTFVGNLSIPANSAITAQSQGTFRMRYSGANVWVGYRMS